MIQKILNIYKLNKNNLDLLNETQMLDSDFHAAFIDKYGSNSFKEANETLNQTLNSKKRNVFI